MGNVYKNAFINGRINDIITKNGKIVSIGKTNLSGIDLCGSKVYPGLIDIHTHGCNGYDTMDGKFSEMADFYARNGVTSWLPTTVTAENEALKELTNSDLSGVKGARIIGFHLEGPYISPKYKGAQNPDYITLPSQKDFESFKNVSMITLAPETEGANDFIKSCKSIVSIGHTGADYETALHAIDLGAKCVTHIFNTMPPLHHREPSVIGAAASRGIYAQVISDGLHIHGAVIMMLYKIFGSDRLILISDSMRGAGLPDGIYNLGGLDVYVRKGAARLKDGTLAGSVATLLSCVKKAIDFGIPESDAFKMASETPAALLGIKKGILKEGYDADFIVLDEKLNLIHTVIGGEIYK